MIDYRHLFSPFSRPVCSLSIVAFSPCALLFHFLFVVSEGGIGRGYRLREGGLDGLEHGVNLRAAAAAV
jgi:hypothetical protein